MTNKPKRGSFEAAIRRPQDPELADRIEQFYQELVTLRIGEVLEQAARKCQPFVNHETYAARRIQDSLVLLLQLVRDRADAVELASQAETFAGYLLELADTLAMLDAIDELRPDAE